MKLGLFAVPMLFALSGCGGTVIPENDGPAVRIYPNSPKMRVGDRVRMEVFALDVFPPDPFNIPVQTIWHQPDRGSLAPFFGMILFTTPPEPGPVKFKVEFRRGNRQPYIHEETLEVFARD